MHKKFRLQFFASNMVTVAGFALSIALARLLTPTDIGIFSMGAVLVGLTHVFRDFGVVAYLKRQKEISEEDLCAVTGILYFTSWTTSVLLYFGSGIWARFLGHDEIECVVKVLALGFLFVPLGAIPQALLARELDVRRTTTIALVSTGVYICASVFLALAGFKHMTMAWANLINILATGFTANLLRPNRVPLRPTFAGWAKVVGFSTGVLVTNTLKAIEAGLSDILLGRLGNPSLVGLHGKANSTAAITTTIISPTIDYFSLPVLAKRFHENDTIENEIISGTTLITGFTWPALVAIGICAEPLILLLYGTNWVTAATAMPWLCLNLAIASIFLLVPPALTGIGRPELAAIPIAAGLFFKTITAIIIFDGTLESFSKALFFGELLAMPSSLWLISRFFGLSIYKLIQSQASALKISSCVFLTALLSINITSGLLAWAQLSITMMLAASTWLLIGWKLEHPTTKAVLNSLRKDSALE